MELFEVDDVVLDNGLLLPRFQVGSADVLGDPFEDLDSILNIELDLVRGPLGHVQVSLGDGAIGGRPGGHDGEYPE